MSTYTYVVDHGDKSPSVGGGQQTINGKVTAVSFTDVIANNEQVRTEFEELLESDEAEELSHKMWRKLYNLTQKI